MTTILICPACKFAWSKAVLFKAMGDNDKIICPNCLISILRKKIKKQEEQK